MEDDAQLQMEQESKLRRVITVLNYLAQDRLGVGFAVKAVAREMAHPPRAPAKVEWLPRFLKDRPREVLHFGWQPMPGSVVVQSDSDWAGCSRTRRSTSGGAIRRDLHMLLHWSRT